MDRLAESSWSASFARASLSLVLATSLSVPTLAFAAPPAADPVTQPQPVAQPQPAPPPYPTDGSRQLHDPFGNQPAPYPAPVVQPQPYNPNPPPPVYYYPQPPQPQYVQPVAPPPPAKPPRKKGAGLAIGGFSMFAGTYLFTVLGGAIAIDTGSPEVGRALMIPIVGPFAGFARLDLANDESDTLALGICGMVFSGIFQLGGLAMGFAGVGLLARSRAEARYSVDLTGDGVLLRF